MDASRTYSEPGHGADLLGPSQYLGRPTLLFAVWGNLGQLIGRIDLFHMRLIHGFFGLLVIAAARRCSGSSCRDAGHSSPPSCSACATRCS